MMEKQTQMELKWSEQNDVRILELSGRFDAYEVPAVSDWIGEHIDADHVKVVINLHGVNFIDSTALATLVKGMKHCRQQGGDLHLCNLDQAVRIIFELTRLDKAFNIYDSVDAATGAF